MVNLVNQSIANAPAAARPRVLILADVCNPDWPSLPILGYRFAKEIAKYTDAVVVTQIRNQPNIDREGMGDAEVVYLDTENVAAPMAKLATFLRGGKSTGWTLQMAMDYPSYLAFERAAWQRFKGDLRNGRFDLVHRITPMSPTLPSYLAKECPLPFIIGPLNGGLRWPEYFTNDLKKEGEWLTYFREAYRLLPYYRSTYQSATAILAAHAHTIHDLPAEAQEKALNFPDTGFDPEKFTLPDRSNRDRLTILFAGRMVPYKQPTVVLQAFANSSLLRQHRLVMIGDGPERAILEAMVREHHLEDCVELVQTVPYAEFPAVMQQADIFAFPSIRELGGGVIVEAMAVGLACVVVDYGGPGVFIGPDRGIKVSLGDAAHLVEQYQTALEDLVSQPEKVNRLGLAAREHVLKHYAWEARGHKLLEVYNWVLGRSETKPDFWRDPEITAASV